MEALTKTLGGHLLGRFGTSKPSSFTRSLRLQSHREIMKMSSRSFPSRRRSSWELNSPLEASTRGQSTNVTVSSASCDTGTTDRWSSWLVFRHWRTQRKSLRWWSPDRNSSLPQTFSTRGSAASYSSPSSAATLLKNASRTLGVALKSTWMLKLILLMSVGTGALVTHGSVAYSSASRSLSSCLLGEDSFLRVNVSSPSRSDASRSRSCPIRYSRLRCCFFLSSGSTAVGGLTAMCADRWPAASHAQPQLVDAALRREEDRHHADAVLLVAGRFPALELADELQVVLGAALRRQAGQRVHGPRRQRGQQHREVHEDREERTPPTPAPAALSLTDQTGHKQRREDRRTHQTDVLQECTGPVWVVGLAGSGEQMHL
ncbi:hypothetical protein EYF80_053314 [Liparis tanakae]|uniref:Uncharacterized protein n=1 Tax=Liparis tanakae TaxID=230148 RepID=A0A4Z2F5W5_9TELE|nr:hypothetical protein EYF80_053314 [Liparis tanakae]